MQHRKSQIENLKQYLETESNLRIKNQEALALMIAQQMFLFSVLTGLSSRPVADILQAGRPMIEAFYKEITANSYRRVETIIENPSLTFIL